MNPQHPLHTLEALPNHLHLLALGQMGLALKGPSGLIVIDPYLTDSDDNGGRLERSFAPPIRPQDASQVSLVLCSHNHVDHFDRHTLEPLTKASPQATVAAPFTCNLDFLEPERRILARAFEPFRHAGATITPIPSAHTELERGPHGYPYLGFVVEWNGVTLYFAGDTLVYEAADGTPGLLETLSHWKLDAAFLPINGRDEARTQAGLVGNMNGQEALELAKVLDIPLVFPGHIDLFAFNSADPKEFATYAHEHHPRQKFRFLEAGEIFTLEGSA